MVERADGVALLQQPGAEALEQPGGHASLGLGILVEVLGLARDASLGQVGREALERVTLGGAGILGLFGVIGGKSITLAGTIGSQARPRQIIAVARTGSLDG